MTRVRLSSSDLSCLNTRVIWGLKSLDAQATAQGTESAGAVRFGAPGGRLVQLSQRLPAAFCLRPPRCLRSRLPAPL